MMELASRMVEAVAFTIGVFMLLLGLARWVLEVKAGQEKKLGPGAMLMAIGSWLLWG